jgi:signal transduction histidine kinase
MICYLFPEPTYFLFSSEVPTLLYYAQIPATLISILLSFYVFWNGKQFLLNRLLLAISFFFGLWTMLTLIAWTNINGDFIVFIWSFFGLILSLIAIFCVYFMYVFLKKKDVINKVKAIFIGLLSPVILLTPSYFNLGGFNITSCDAFDFEWLPFKIYVTSLGVLAMMWILVLVIREYRISNSNFRRQITLMGIGIELFLFSFFGMEFVATYLTKIGIFPDSQLELYGLFGMVIFMIYISILMVRFKAFHTKLLATQALVWGLIALIGSQFFFIKTPINFVLNGIGFLVSIILGQYLIKSVKKEIEQKEKLITLNISLKDLIQQRESLVHLVTHKVKGSFTRTKYLFTAILDGSFGEISPEIRRRAQQGLEFDIGGIQTVDLVLEASNLASGTIKYDMKNIDFKDIVQKMAEEKKIPAETKGLKIESDIKDGEYNILGDANWIKEAINNLVENSIRYTKEGKITIGLERKSEKILFSVKDTGIGITDEDKKNLFTEGGRGKDSTKMNVDSTGYGLYSVKLIIEAHKGRVWAESELGKGSTFFIELDAIS